MVGSYNYSQGRSFLTGNEENPALVLSNVHNRTSARDGPMFGSMGPSMNTSSLVFGHVNEFFDACDACKRECVKF